MLNEGNGISVKFIIVIATLAVFGFAFDEAYAAHTISTFVADDPDNGDTVYSNDDTLTITFSGATNQTGAASQVNINGNFTFSVALGATYSGVWTDPSTLFITVTSTAGEGGVTIGVTTATPTGGNNIGDLGSTHALGGGGVLLSGDFGIVSSGGGDGCNGECSAPTLGVNSEGYRLVDNGFSYNGKAVDVESF